MAEERRSEHTPGRKESGAAIEAQKRPVKVALVDRSILRCTGAEPLQQVPTLIGHDTDTTTSAQALSVAFLFGISWRRCGCSGAGAGGEHAAQRAWEALGRLKKWLLGHRLGAPDPDTSEANK